MKITIDTKEDSHEDIRKVIKMLGHLVGEQVSTNQPNIFEDPAPQPETGSAFMNMFGDSAPKTDAIDQSESDESTIDEPTEPVSEEKEDVPEVIPY